MLQQLLALVNPLDIAVFLDTLPAKIDKDEARTRLFSMATTKKTAEIALAFASNVATQATPTAEGEMTPNPALIKVNGIEIAPTAETLKMFGEDLAAIVGEYIHNAEAMLPKKWSLHSLFGSSDPFAPKRKEVRTFADKWDLDRSFRAAMG